MLGNDQLTHMVPIPPAEPQEIDTFAKIAILTFLQAQNEQVSNNHTQPMYSDLTLANQIKLFTSKSKYTNQ